MRAYTLWMLTLALFSVVSAQDSNNNNNGNGFDALDGEDPNTPVDAMDLIGETRPPVSGPPGDGQNQPPPSVRPGGPGNGTAPVVNGNGNNGTASISVNLTSPAPSRFPLSGSLSIEGSASGNSDIEAPSAVSEPPLFNSSRTGSKASGAIGGKNTTTPKPTSDASTTGLLASAVASAVVFAVATASV